MKNRPHQNKLPKAETPLLSVVHLIGDAEENFYQLGLKDAELGKKLHIDALTLVKSNSKSIDKLIKLGAKEFVKHSLFQKPERFPLLKAYAEGMKIDFHELALVMMSPELASSLPHWLKEITPNIPLKLMGCSSLFYRNHNQEMNHLRILDFPLKGSYDEQERALLFEFKNWPKIFSFGSVGMPYPSISLMTEHGISIALHQKFSKVFNTKGMPIFEYILDFARHVKNPEDALSYVKSHQSFTTWCMNIGFKCGEVLSIDLMGEKVEIKRGSIDDPKSPFIYFNNQLLDSGILQSELLPFGFQSYNEMREESAMRKIHALKEMKNKLSSTQSSALSSAEVVRLFTMPKHLVQKNSLNDKKTKTDQQKIWCLDVITPSSLQIMNFNLQQESSIYLTGPTPKIYRDNLIDIQNVFRKPTQTEIKFIGSQKNYQDHEFELGLQELMLAQKSLDYHELSNCYHHLQMSIDHFHESQDKSAAYVGRFFFNVLQFLHDDHLKVRKHLRDEFQSLKGHLPYHLEDHRLLFVARLNRFIDGNFAIEEDNITHSALRKLLNLEAQIPLLIYFQTIKNLTTVRLDMLDIVYLHSASD